MNNTESKLERNTTASEESIQPVKKEFVENVKLNKEIRKEIPEEQKKETKEVQHTNYNPTEVKSFKEVLKDIKECLSTCGGKTLNHILIESLKLLIIVLELTIPLNFATEIGADVLNIFNIDSTSTSLTIYNLICRIIYVIVAAIIYVKNFKIRFSNIQYKYNNK